MNLKWVINGIKNANPDEAVRFHRVALPIFAVICLIIYFTY